MLKNDFYTITGSQVTDNQALVSIRLNAEHFIFKAHFPENPITPGVCIIQIIKEIVEDISKRKLILSVARNIKFLHIINPLKYEKINFRISYNYTDDQQFIHANTQVEYDEIIFVKASMSYKIL
jgi:3-hydroxyacyl-[acyl-carrier-protein] dehydratase